MTQSGKPLVANDPHRVIGLPSLRYMVHLVAPGWDVIGAGEPGLPGVALGHNQHIAWGFTIFGLDQQDLYLEELNPTKSARIQERIRLEENGGRERLHSVKSTAPVEIELKFTEHGPVLWTDGTRALALRWVGSEPGTAGYLGFSGHRSRSELAGLCIWRETLESTIRKSGLRRHFWEHWRVLSWDCRPVRKNWTGLLPVPGDGKYRVGPDSFHSRPAPFSQSQSLALSSPRITK